MCNIKNFLNINKTILLLDRKVAISVIGLDDWMKIDHLLAIFTINEGL